MTRISLPRIEGLMSPERDIPGAAPVRMRYLICSSPRVGSNLLCAVLRQTGAAGDPLEYLNPRYMKAGARRMGGGPVTIAAYLAALEARRTSPSGVFGLKVHYGHLAALMKDEPARMAAFLARFDRHILMVRGDKIAQAVSLHKAQATGFWTEEDRAAHRATGAADPSVPFDPQAIARALLSIITEEQGWRSLLSGTTHVEVRYEDLAADIDGVGRRVCAELGVDPPASLAPAAAPSRQADGQSGAQYGAFLRHCGLGHLLGKA